MERGTSQHAIIANQTGPQQHTSNAPDVAISDKKQNKGGLQSKIETRDRRYKVSLAGVALGLTGGREVEAFSSEGSDQSGLRLMCIVSSNHR